MAAISAFAWASGSSKRRRRTISKDSCARAGCHCCATRRITFALRDTVAEAGAETAIGAGLGGGADIGEGDAGTGRGERFVTLPQGAVFVVPRGVEHRPSSAGGASILMFEPTGTPTVGDRHDPIPDHVDATIGHPLG